MKHFPLTCLLLAASASAQLDAIRTLVSTNGQEVLRPVESNIFATATAELPAREAELLELFQAPETTLEGKQYACRMLRFCASDASIPALAPALSDPDLSQFARLVLQGLESSKAERALAEALPVVDTTIRAGIIGTLGTRGSEKSVKAIKPWLENTEPDVQFAAITALGTIGGNDAAKALDRATVSPALAAARKHALLQCAEGLKSRSAKKIYEQLSDDADADIRAAALIGLTRIDPKAAAPDVLAQLGSTDPRMQRTATGLLNELPTKPLLKTGATTDSANKAAILGVLASRPEPGVEDTIIRMMADTNAVVQTAGHSALGKIGGEKSLQFLINAAPGNKDAFNALTVLNTEGADARIVAALQSSGDDDVCVAMLKCLARRRSHDALPAIVEIAEEAWSPKTKTAIATLGTLVKADEFDIFARLLVGAQEPEKIKALERSIPQAARRQLDEEACTLPLIAAFDGSTEEPRKAILRTIGNLGGEPARALLTQSLEHPELKEDALRGLCSWPNIDVADQLLEQARTAEDEQHRVLALRGYIRLAGTVNEFEKAFDMCLWAAEAAEQPDELKSIISCMKRFKKQEVLDFLVPRLENPEIFNEAAWALCEISTNRSLREASIYPLRQIVEFAADEDLVAEANKRLGQSLKQVEAESV